MKIKLQIRLIVNSIGIPTASNKSGFYFYCPVLKQVAMFSVYSNVTSGHRYFIHEHWTKVHALCV